MANGLSGVKYKEMDEQIPTKESASESAAENPPPESIEAKPESMPVLEEPTPREPAIESTPVEATESSSPTPGVGLGSETPATEPAPELDTPQEPAESAQTAQEKEETAQTERNEPFNPPAASRPTPAAGRIAIEMRKRKKLDKILTLFETKKEIANDEVEKLLHVSDATATRYLEILEREGRITQLGQRGRGVRYVRVS